MAGPFKMAGFSGFGNASPAKQKDIGADLQKKYKGKKQTTTKSGYKITPYAQDANILTQEKRSEQVNRPISNPFKPGSPKVESEQERVDVHDKAQNDMISSTKKDKYKGKWKSYYPE
jgi:hypothetical protein